MNLVSYQKRDDQKFIYVFGNVDGESLAGRVGKMFGGEGYKLEEGTVRSGIYGNGNPLLRTFLGGFAKRYRFSLDIIDQGLGVQLVFSKAMSGAMGGFMGYRSLNKEFERIAEIIKAVTAN